MLTHLRVRRFAIIDQLEVAFGAGLNVVTGETGAGKSILVSALQLVLGAKARPEMVRTGAERAEVEALFDIRDDGSARARLAAMGIEDDELVVRRVVEAEGRTRAYVNGKLATAAQLAELAAGLVDISSQHQHHTLADAGTHLGFLDGFAGLGKERVELAERWRAWVAARNAADEADAAARARGDREDLLRFQLSEIDKLAPKAGEEEGLNEQIGRLRHGAQLAGLTTRAEEALYSGEADIVGQLTRVVADLESGSRVDPALAPLARQLDGARAEVEDVGRELGRYGRTLRADPERLAELEERLHQLRRLARKFGGTLAEVLVYRATAAAELAALGGAEERAGALRSAAEAALADVTTLARAMSARRHAEAARLGAAITDELSSLGMGEARVEVAVALEERPGEVLVDGGRLGATGFDRVEFLIATNRGEAPRPLRKVASGGELSRALLALKRVLASQGPVGLYVFDEVDTGVGGAVAEVIGRKLHEVSQHHQVLCITHLAQIAVYADTHFQVRKEVFEDRTRSAVRLLSPTERDDEIARMVGGIHVGEATRLAAAEMIRAARGEGGRGDKA
jgi:DNA repair protein RecN (Recombination protein N)